MKEHIFSAEPVCPHCGTRFEFSARLRELPQVDTRKLASGATVVGPVTRWIRQRIVFMEGARATVAELQADYNAWADANGCERTTARAVADRLVAYGYPRHRSTNGVRCIANVAICADAIGTPETADDAPEPPRAPQQPSLVERWAAECVVRAPGKFVSAKDLKHSHHTWAAANGAIPAPMREVNDHLSSCSSCRRSTGLPGGVPGIVGVRLRDPALDTIL